MTNSAESIDAAFYIGNVISGLAMAHSMKLRVVAEGVEQESQLAFLRNQGCDEVQGFLISKPVSAQVFTRLLQSRLYSNAPETC